VHHVQTEGTPLKVLKEREGERAFPPDLERNARIVAVHFLGITRPQRKPTESEIQSVAVIAIKALKAGHTVKDLKRATRGATTAAKTDEWLTYRVDDPAFVWMESRIAQHSALPMTWQDWEKAKYPDPWTYWADQERKEREGETA
jgi:hypothetical protein